MRSTDVGYDPAMMTPDPAAARRRRFNDSHFLALPGQGHLDKARRAADLLQYVFSLKGATRLPADEDLARGLLCSRNIIRVALHELQEGNNVERAARMGTYLRPTDSQWPTDTLIDQPMMQLEGENSIGDHSLVGWAEYSEVPPLLQPLLVDGAERFVIYERLVRYGDRPGALRTVFLPLRAGEHIGPEDAFGDIYHDILGDRLAYVHMRSTRIISAIHADESAAGHLRVKPGHPLLFAETRVYNADNRVILLSNSRQRSDVVQLALEPKSMTRHPD